jgi:type VI secretion system secreted protein Hcp
MKTLWHSTTIICILLAVISINVTAQNIREINTREIKSTGLTVDGKALGYVTIEGTKQGKFKGDDATSQSKSEFFDYSFSLSQPIDATSGQATGKAKYGAVTIVKKNGYSTPQIIQALTTNEVLKSVLIEFVKIQSDGMQVVYYTVKLTNARISRVNQTCNNEQPSLKQGSFPLDEVSFVFQKIEIEHKEGKTMTDGDVGY